MGSQDTARIGTRGALVMLLIFGGLLAVFDVVLIRQWWMTRVARDSWFEVPAEVLESRVEVDTSGDSTSYTPLVRYSYRVDGQLRESSRYSFGDSLHFGSAAAKRAVREHPVGAPVTAHVDPSDPTNAVLLVDTEGLPRMVWIFLMPFHCVVLGIVSALFGRGRATKEELFERRFLRVDEPDHLVVAKRPAHFVISYVIALGALSFIATFVLAFGFGEEKGEQAALPMMAGILVAAAVCALVYQQRAKRPARFLHVDLGRWTFAYPADAAHEPLPDVPRLRVESRRTSGSTNGEQIHRHRVLMADINGESETELFTFKGARHDGEAVADLIARRLHR